MCTIVHSSFTRFSKFCIVRYFFQVALFPCRTVFAFLSFFPFSCFLRVAVFSFCNFFALHSFNVSCFFHFSCFLCVSLFSLFWCCIHVPLFLFKLFWFRFFSCWAFSVLHHIHAAFLCCTFFVLHSIHVALSFVIFFRTSFL